MLHSVNDSPDRSVPSGLLTSLLAEFCARPKGLAIFGAGEASCSLSKEKHHLGPVVGPNKARRLTDYATTTLFKLPAQVGDERL